MYMAMGMTYQEYWCGDPWLCKYYREADLIKQKIRNQDLWLQGLYNYNALAVAISNAFGGKNTNLKYLENPLDIFPKTEAEKEEEARKERDRITEQFKAMIEAQKRRKELNK